MQHHPLADVLFGQKSDQFAVPRDERQRLSLGLHLIDDAVERIGILNHENVVPHDLGDASLPVGFGQRRNQIFMQHDAERALASTAGKFFW